MQFLTSLFGGSGNSLITTLLALGLVLVMVVAGVWLLKLVFRASSNVGRGRNRRLTVIDSMSVDPKRQLLIVRRDNVEHLILTGGPQDVIVETGIPVEKPVAPARRPVPVPAAKPGAIPLRPKAVAKGEAPGAAPAPAENRSALEQLRDLTRPVSPRPSQSLRHTGLLRPVTRMEPAPENSAPRLADSATTGPVEATGQSKGGDGNFGAYRGDRKVDPNS